MALTEYRAGTTFPGIVGRTTDRSSPAWPEPNREVQYIDFDYATQVAIGEGLVLFGSRDEIAERLATLRGDLAQRVAAATDHELTEQLRLRETVDFAEGTRAMAERRPPRFLRS